MAKKRHTPPMIHDLYRILEHPRPWRHLHEPAAPSKPYEVTTDDGVTLKLRRVPPRAPARNAPPVMLLHGLAANHRGFHFRERSFADWLSERGHDVWLPELRGHGDSKVDRFDWRFDDYIDQDLPAILDTIRRQTDREQIHWVGHSMGGVLLMSYGIRHPEAPIARGVAVGSALDYKVGETGFEPLLAIRPLIERLVAIPYGTLMHLLAPALGRGPQSLEAFNVWPSNIDPHLVRCLHARCFHTIPTSLLSSLATTFEPRGLRLASGFRFVDRAPDLSFPVLLVAGNRDRQVSVEAIEHTAQLIGDNAQVTVHGREHGNADHYGHWDLLIGRRAPDETWPGIARFLEAGG